MNPLIPLMILGTFFATRKSKKASTTTILDSETIDILSKDESDPTSLELAVGEVQPIYGSVSAGSAWESSMTDGNVISITKKLENTSVGMQLYSFDIIAKKLGYSLVHFKKFNKSGVIDDRYLSVHVVYVPEPKDVSWVMNF